MAISISQQIRSLLRIAMGNRPVADSFIDALENGSGGGGGGGIAGPSAPTVVNTIPVLADTGGVALKSSSATVDSTGKLAVRNLAITNDGSASYPSNVTIGTLPADLQEYLDSFPITGFLVAGDSGSGVLDATPFIGGSLLDFGPNSSIIGWVAHDQSVQFGFGAGVDTDGYQNPGDIMVGAYLGQSAVRFPVAGGIDILHGGLNTPSIGSLVSGSGSIDMVHSQMSDSDGNTSIDWAGRVLGDSNGTTNGASVGWSQRYLFDVAENISLDWDNRVLKNVDFTIPLDWAARNLIDINSTVVLNWSDSAVLIGVPVKATPGGQLVLSGGLSQGGNGFGVGLSSTDADPAGGQGGNISLVTGNGTVSQSGGNIQFFLGGGVLPGAFNVTGATGAWTGTPSAWAWNLGANTAGSGAPLTITGMGSTGGVGNGGGVTIVAGASTGTGATGTGGAMNITSGGGGGTSGRSGALNVKSGAAVGNAGQVVIAGGNSSGANGGNMSVNGGSGSTAGGNVTIAAGAVTGTGTAGPVNISGGQGTASNQGGAVTITGGVTVTGTAGAVNISGGAASNASGTSAGVNISGGNATGSGVAGGVTISGGTSATTSNAGTIVLKTANTTRLTVNTDGSIVATGQVRMASLGVGNFQSATVLGALVGVHQVFDASGAALGYAPVYASFT